jgi:hypothetical protein
MTVGKTDRVERRRQKTHSQRCSAACVVVDRATINDRKATENFMLKRQLDAKAGGPEQREWRTRGGGRHAPRRNRVGSRGEWRIKRGGRGGANAGEERERGRRRGVVVRGETGRMQEDRKRPDCGMAKTCGCKEKDRGRREHKKTKKKVKLLGR